MKNIAIVTGASSGIGNAFLKLVCKERGIYNSIPFDEIWAVSRSADKLLEATSSIGDERIVPVTADLTDPGDLDEIALRLQDECISVGLLINCAGAGFKGYTEDLGIDNVGCQVELNCVALSKLTRICLPHMIDKEPPYSLKDGPRIVNVASSAGFLPQPGFAGYAASKAYVISFSRALSYELAPYNIAVTTVCPGPVKTEFQSKATGGQSAEFTGFRKYVASDKDKLAKAALKASKAGRKMFVYGFSQKALHVASKILPSDLILSIESKLITVPEVNTYSEGDNVVTPLPVSSKEESV